MLLKAENQPPLPLLLLLAVSDALTSPLALLLLPLLLLLPPMLPM
jgi:hypothetical protein